MGHVLFWIAVGLWVLGDMYLVFFHNRKLKTDSMERRSKFLVIGLILAGIFGARYLDPTTLEAFQAPFHSYRYLALFLIPAGMILRVSAVRQLGAGFSGNLGINKGGGLFTDGLYKYVRHPSYTGLLISFLGVAIAFAHPVSSTMTFLFPTAAFLYRISLEEKILYQQFGDEYRRYAACTKKLIPYLY